MTEPEARLPDPPNPPPAPFDFDDGLVELMAEETPPRPVLPPRPPSPPPIVPPLALDEPWEPCPQLAAAAHAMQQRIADLCLARDGLPVRIFWAFLCAAPWRASLRCNARRC